MTNNAQAELVGRLRGGKCPDCQGWGEVAYFGEMVSCKCRGQYEAPISMEARREAAAEIERMAGVIEALREALQPFADLADFLDEHPDPRWKNPHDEFQCGDFAYSIGVGQVQAARRALGGGE